MHHTKISTETEQIVVGRMLSKQEAFEERYRLKVYRFQLANLQHVLSAICSINDPSLPSEEWIAKRTALEMGKPPSEKIAGGIRFLIQKGQACSEEEFREYLDLLTEQPEIEVLPEPWPRVEAFTEKDLPTFPTCELPPVLREFVEALSYATQTPHEFSAMMCLAVCAAAIAKRVEVEGHSGWIEPVNLFVMVIAGPGNRKSAVVKETTRPLYRKEAELIEFARPIIARAESDRRRKETRLKMLEKKAAEAADSESIHEADELAEELSQTPVIVQPRLIVDDATSEKLAVLLADHGRLACISAEAGVFNNMAGRYSKNGASDIEPYLKGHAGDDLRVDRISRASVSVSAPALTCAFMVQPVAAEGFAENRDFRGRGLLARFLSVWPRSPVGNREIAAPPVPDEVRDAYQNAVFSLFEWPDRHTLRPEPEAEELLLAWEEEIEGMLDEGGAMEHLREWGSKLAGATLRLAGVLHCMEHGLCGSLSPSTLQSAITIAKYLIPHAEAVHNTMGAKESRGESDAKYLLRWILRHGKHSFNQSEAQHHGKRRFPRATDIEPALEELVRRGYIRLLEAEPTKPGRPSSPAYEVNPAVIQNTETRSQYSRNSIPRPQRVSIGNKRSASEPVTAGVYDPFREGEVSHGDF